MSRPGMIKSVTGSPLGGHSSRSSEDPDKVQFAPARMGLYVCPEGHETRPTFSLTAWDDLLIPVEIDCRCGEAALIVERFLRYTRNAQKNTASGWEKIKFQMDKELHKRRTKKELQANLDERLAELRKKRGQEDE